MDYHLTVGWNKASYRYCHNQPDDWSCEEEPPIILNLPPVIQHSYGKWLVYRWFTCWKGWFFHIYIYIQHFIAMLKYQRETSKLPSSSQLKIRVCSMLISWHSELETSLPDLWSSEPCQTHCLIGILWWWLPNRLPGLTLFSPRSN